MADPYLLGISHGASLGAVAALLLGTSTSGLFGFGVSGAAFLGALGWCPG
ncbi:iron chelate uptake ABC transporter family permease subunit [Streptomyces sp. NPDC003781]